MERKLFTMTTQIQGAYNCIDDMWLNAINNLLVAEVTRCRLGNTRELVGYAGVLFNTSNNLLLNTRRAIDPSYACAEVLWYLSRVRSIKMLKAYAPQYTKFAEDDIAHGAYGYRIAHNSSAGDQLLQVINMLKDSPNTRQAVVTFWDADEDLEGASLKKYKDLPCTIAWVFRIDNGLLYMHGMMRSQDVWLGMPYDVFVNTTIMKMIAAELRLKCGPYIHTCTSFHIYEKHWEAAKECFDDDVIHAMNHDVVECYTQYTFCDGFRNLGQALQVEQQARLTGKLNTELSNDLMFDVAQTCAHKWDVAAYDLISSPTLKKGLRNYVNRRRS
jgi:thymidylate synthase